MRRRLRSTTRHRRLSRHHRFHVRHTAMQRARSAGDSSVKTRVHSARSIACRSPLVVATYSGGGLTGAGRMAYFWMRVRGCFSGTASFSRLPPVSLSSDSSPSTSDNEPNGAGDTDLRRLAPWFDDEAPCGLFLYVPLSESVCKRETTEFA